MSNYWTPQLYVTMKDGTFQPVPVRGDPTDSNGGMTVYYLQRPGTPDEKLHAFPEGFRMLAGDSSKRTGGDDLPTKGISFACLGSDKAETNNMPNYQCENGLRAQVFFPSCWNGKDLDSSDHKSHMSYPNSQHYDNGPCPATHPVHFISIFYEILYDTNLFADQWNGTQHPFVFANGDATGYGFHGDFVNGWDVNVLQTAIDNCTDASGQVEKCSAVTMYKDEESNSCKLPTIVQETIDGKLNKLPGCNPVTYGPDRAPPGNCAADGVVFGTGPKNYVDLTKSKRWEYAGCGTDNAVSFLLLIICLSLLQLAHMSQGDRAFTGKSFSSDTMTVPTCIDFCAASNATYAGLEYSGECFCGSELKSPYAPKDGIMGNCGYKCSGDASQICGGWAAMSVYHKCDGDACQNVEIGGGKVPTSTKVKRGRLHAREVGL
jgi:hypothetical protein